MITLHFHLQPQYIRISYAFHVNGQCSSPQTVCCDVPQGSILGPLVFLLYINELKNVSTVVELILFANDTSLLMSYKDAVYLA